MPAGKARRRERTRNRWTGTGNPNANVDEQTHNSKAVVTLSSLGPFRYTIKQGDRKRRDKSRGHIADDADSIDSGDGGIRVSAPSLEENMTEDTFALLLSPPQGTTTTTTTTTPRSSSLFYRGQVDEEDWEGDDEESDCTVNPAKSKDRAVDPQEKTPTKLISTHPQISPQDLHYQPTNSSFRRLDQSTTYTQSLESPPPFIPYNNTRSPAADSETSAQSIQALNKQVILFASPGKGASRRRIMNTSGDIFEAREWDGPESSSAPDPDASPERVAVKPKPLTYTTVGSIAKATDAHQFTAPNRIQREGRAGLEVTGRRPLLTTAATARSQEFFSARNAPQYPNGQNYSQGFGHDQSLAAQYQSTQYGPRSLAQGPSFATIYPQSSQAGHQNFTRDQSPTAGQELHQFEARNVVQEQSSRQSFDQEPSQSSASLSKTLHQKQLSQYNAMEQSLSHAITPLEERVLKSLGAPLPMAPREEIPLPNAGRSIQQALPPMQKALLAQLKAVKPHERSGNTTHRPTESSDLESYAAQRSDQAMIRDAFLSGSMTNSAARLQDAKMSTVQRLAQFPNPDQECAKARLAELAASKMRGIDENDKFVQQKDRSKQFDFDYDSVSGGRTEMDQYYKGTGVAENETDHSFRIPNQHRNSGSSSTYNSKAVSVPRMTPQGYPQPLTAGPPGQRQNAVPSTNRALISMQQMVANNRPRVSQYTAPQHSVDPLPSRHSFESRTSDAQTLVEDKIIRSSMYPWAALDSQPRDFTEGAPTRVRETLSYEDAKIFYPNGMDMDVTRTMITTLPYDEALKHYPTGMDDGTREWYETERKWQQKPQSDLGTLLDGSVPPDKWLHNSAFRYNNNSNRDTTGAWFHSGSRQVNSERVAETSAPGIIGQPRQSSRVSSSGNDNPLSLDEIRSMPLKDSTETLFTNAIIALRRYKEKTPENIAMLKARGFGAVPAYAIDTRPDSNNSFFSKY